MSALRILLIEDNALLARELAATLGEIDGVEMIGTAASEERAMQMLRSARGIYDLIVIDIFLASGSGLGVLRAAVALQPDARIVMLTNYATMDVRKSCTQMGADRVFDKSRQTEEFIGYCARLARGQADTQPQHDDGPATVPLE